MTKRIIIFATMIFLLFEVLYFNSNSRLQEMNDQENSAQVYQFALKEGQEEFLHAYQDIILEDRDTSFVVLTNSKVIEEIQEKYPITIEK